MKNLSLNSKNCLKITKSRTFTLIRFEKEDKKVNKVREYVQPKVK